MATKKQTSSYKPKTKAGKAFLRSIGNNLESKQKLQTTIEGIQEKIKSLAGTLGVAADDWEQRLGLPYPECVEDLQQLVVRAGFDAERASMLGLDAERVRKGEWTFADAEPIIRGYLERLRDKPVDEQPVWVGPKSPKEWSNILRISPKTFKRWCDSGKLRHRSLSAKSYLIHKGDLPNQVDISGHK